MIGASGSLPLESGNLHRHHTFHKLALCEFPVNGVNNQAFRDRHLMLEQLELLNLESHHPEKLHVPTPLKCR